MKPTGLNGAIILFVGIPVAGLVIGVLGLLLRVWFHLAP